MTSDPIGLKAGPNTYSYVSSNPLRNIDIRGLIEWTGTMSGVAATAPVGALYYIFNLESDCVDGEKAIIEVVATGAAGGVGGVYGVGFSGSSVKFHDHDDEINIDNANGLFSMISVSLSWGVGYGCADIALGSDGMDAGMLHFSCGMITGIEGGAMIVPLTGSSTVMKSRREKCCDNK